MSPWTFPSCLCHCLTCCRAVIITNPLRARGLREIRRKIYKYSVWHLMTATLFLQLYRFQHPYTFRCGGWTFGRLWFADVCTICQNPPLFLSVPNQGVCVLLPTGRLSWPLPNYFLWCSSIALTTAISKRKAAALLPLRNNFHISLLWSLGYLNDVF